MKNTFLILSIFPLVWLLQSCKLDNIEPPKSELKGKVAYNGQALDLRHTSIVFDLQQDGFELSNTIEVFVAQDGTFAAKLFDGDYKMVARNNNGPWLNNSQPVTFTVKGNTEIEFGVTPYFMLSKVGITLTGNSLTGSCTVDRTGGTNNVSQLTLYVGKTQFVDDRDPNKIALSNVVPVAGASNAVTLDIGNILSQNPVLYARLGLQIDGVSERIYSGVVKIK